MENKYEEQAKLFKALSEPNRLMIIDMLSCGELCACKILEKMNITQPTLSHHMKILCECQLVSGRREGKWIHYSLNFEKIKSLKQVFFDIISNSEICICKESAL